MHSTDDRDQPVDPSPTVARLYPASLSDSAPGTFPSEVNELLKHLKLGAGSGSVALGSPAGFAPAGAGAPGGPVPHIPGYEIESELGRGGMGVVYKARHNSLRHTVAVKMILASAHAAPGEVARFVAEAEAVAAVKHPNVVQVFDLGVTPGPGPDAGRPYFVMECVDGGNLAAHLKAAGGSLPPDDAAEMIEAVARGVNAANDVGIVHRDLKPANILLAAGTGHSAAGGPDKSKSGSASVPRTLLALQPKVSDFGLAKRLSSDLTRSQAVMGTPAYMAPEQAGGKAKFVGPQADVYALGVILYQCLTGGVPFDNPDPWSLIRQVLEDTPPSPRARAPHVPRDLELICLKCLEKEAHHRYPTAAALADDLRRFLNRETVSVRPIGAPTRLVRWAKKRPATAALAVLGVLLGVSVPALVVGVKARFERQDAVNVEAQRTADEARRAEAEAKRAEDAAKRAQAAAEQLAAARELFALQNKMRTRAGSRLPGWTAETLGELPKAVALARGEPAVLEDLRSAAATALLSDDLFAADPVVPGMNAAALATDPNTGRVAVGEYKSWLDCKVLVVDPRTGNTAHTLAYPTVTLKGKNPFEVVQDGTRALAFSPNGKLLFVGTRSGRVIRFDLDALNAPPKIWQASALSFGHLEVSADGKTVYTVCGIDEPVRAWNAETGDKLQPLAPPVGEQVHGFAVLPEGGAVVACGEKLRFWDAAGKAVRSAPARDADRVAIGPGSVLLVGAGARLAIYDRTVEGAVNEFTDPVLRRAAHEDPIRTLAVHPSRTFLATAAGDNERTVRVWELASGRLVAAVVVPGAGPIRLAWSGDGEFLLATAHEHVARWRFAPSPAQRFACGAAMPIDAAAFLSGGRTAALTELHGFREMLVGRAGESAAAFVVAEPGGDGRASLSATPGGTVAFTLSTKGLWLWNPGSPFPPADFVRNSVRTARVGRDGRTLWAVFGGTEVRAVDPEKKNVRGKWDNSVADKLTGLGTVEVLAAGRERAAAATRDGSVYLLDTACAPIATFRRAGDPVLAVAVAGDDSLAAAGTRNGTLRLIRPADNIELPPLAAHPTGVSAVAIGPDGALLATGGRDRAVRLWKRVGDRYEPLLTVSGLPDAVRDLQFHPTEGRLLVLLERQHAVRVWDVTGLNTQLTAQKIGW